MEAASTVPTAGLMNSILLKLMPPVIDFGSPVQRANPDKEHESHWHVPITIRPSVPLIGPKDLSACEVYLDHYEVGQDNREHLMRWGDLQFESQPRRIADLRHGHFELVPIAWRSELGGGGDGYITDAAFSLEERRFTIPIKSDQAWCCFKLRTKSGTFERESKHFYRIRCPQSASNGQFSVEVEYAGGGHVRLSYLL